MRAKHRAVSGGLTFRLTLILLIVAALGMTVMGLYITRVLETYSTENFKSDLVKEARLIQDDIASVLMKDMNDTGPNSKSASPSSLRMERS